MDRFKFRRFVKCQHKSGFDSASLDGYGMNVLKRQQCSCLTQEFGEWQQCTGLKDKNGKLIYEGDVISMSHMYHECYCTSKPCECPPLTGDTVGEVALLPSEGYVLKNNHFIDDEGEFVAKRKKYSKLYSTHEIYIRGNIHENPELLSE